MGRDLDEKRRRSGDLRTKATWLNRKMWVSNCRKVTEMGGKKKKRYPMSTKQFRALGTSTGGKIEGEAGITVRQQWQGNEQRTAAMGAETI